MAAHPLYKKFSQSIFTHLGGRERGVVAVLFVIIILLVALGLTLSVVPSFVATLQTLKNVSYSQQAYYAAESGVEDAAYRVVNAMPHASSYNLAVGSANAAITATTVGPSTTIESDGSQQNRIRKIETVFTITSSQVGFNFAVQVGSDGLSMGNGSSIAGNLFSDGDIDGPGDSKASITGTAQAAGSSTLQGIKVNGDAYGNSLQDCEVGGTAYYFSSINNCPAPATQQLSSQVQSQPLPISQDQIDQWKNDALAGGTLNGYTLGNNTSGTIGPKKINGDINLGNSTTLTLGGTVWVTGTIHLGNTDIIQLDPGYGAESGILIFDGSITMQNSVITQGSGQPGSHLMVLSTDTGEAINLGNTGQTDIFYASDGTIVIQNGGNFSEVTGKGLNIGNNVAITYQSGLSNTSFTSGPGGGWQLISWKEIP